MLRRSPSVTRAFHSARQFHSRGRDGCGLLPGARTARVLANAQRRRASLALLLCVPVLGGSRERRLEPGGDMALDSRWFRIVATALPRQTVVSRAISLRTRLPES